jgi:integrase
MNKPDKPYQSYPLFAHVCGKWAKKIDGKSCYFGTWDDPDKALAEYRAYIDDKELSDEGLSIAGAANLFLTSKKSQVDSGLMAKRTYSEYRSTLKAMLEHWGREYLIEDIDQNALIGYHKERSATRNLVSMGNECVRVKTFFLYLQERELIPEIPKFPEEFKKPSKKLVRRHKREVGSKVIPVEDIRRLLFNAGGTLKPMILLGLQGGFSPADIANLQVGHVHIESKIIDMPRVKTEVDRVVPLWYETINALNNYRDNAPKAANKEAGFYFFRTPSGHRLNPDKSEFTNWFTSLARQCGLPKATAYWLRHTCQNIGERTGDSTAVKMLMGHADQSISDTYRHEIGMDRLQAVTTAINDWLYQG